MTAQRVLRGVAPVELPPFCAVCGGYDRDTCTCNEEAPTVAPLRSAERMIGSLVLALRVAVAEFERISYQKKADASVLQVLRLGISAGSKWLGKEAQ